MAKDKRALEDLDAELAALEAELAALDARKKGKGKGTPKPTQTPAPRPVAPPGPMASAPEPTPSAQPEPQEAPAKKGRFGVKLPRMGNEKKTAPPLEVAEDAPPKTPRLGLKLPLRKGKAVEAPEPAAENPIPVDMVQAPPPTPAAPRADPPAHDLSRWRHEGSAWVRVVDQPVPTVRRILDAEGNLLREEPVGPEAVEAVDEVKAEKGVRRLFGRR